MIQTKLCSKCKEELNIVNFEKRKESRDGYRGQCKSCRNEGKRHLYSIKFGSDSRKWTEEEKLILYEYYPILSADEISEEYLNHRTPNQIRDYAIKKLKLKKEKGFNTQWRTWQKDYLVNNYANIHIPVKEMSKVLGKSEASIMYMAKHLNIKREHYKKSYWSNEEIEILNKYYSDMSNEDIKNNLLPNKNIKQITGYANKNGLRKSDEYIREHRISHGINNLINVNNKKEPTKPELITESILKDLNITYKFQDFDKYYWIDFYLPNNNLIIEVQGDYFHCHPKFNFTYNALNKNKIIAKDKRKHSYFRNKGVEILYLWEHDLNNNIEICKELIGQYVNNNGKLEDYHSYNYILDENKLEVSDDIIDIGY